MRRFTASASKRELGIDLCCEIRARNPSRQCNYEHNAQGHPKIKNIELEKSANDSKRHDTDTKNKEPND